MLRVSQSQAVIPKIVESKAGQRPMMKKAKLLVIPCFSFTVHKNNISNEFLSFLCM